MDSSSSSEDKPVNLVAAWTKGRKDAEKPLTGATAGAPLPNEPAAAPLVSSSFRRQLENMQPERLKALFAAALRTPPIGTITAQIEAEAAAVYERRPADGKALQMAMLHRIFRDTGHRNMTGTGEQETVEKELDKEDIGNDH
ncbi:hypothetical protein B0H10DRAFT_2429942 [Mycena sp. CBHHK59/15]|nr:hypothetical protein B0H10DRAFT_2429942 [Mycena sp. CBHHK59/15]